MQDISFEFRVECAKRIPIFSGLSREAINYLATVIRIVTHARGEFIYLPGDTCETVYFVQNGKIKLTMISEDGAEAALQIVSRGGMFGEIDAILAQPRSTSARVLEDAELCEMTRVDFQAMLDRYPQLASNILRRVAIRLRQIENRLVSLMGKDVGARVKETLVDLTKTQAKDSLKAPIIVSITQQDLADLIGASRQETAKALKKLKDDNTIELKYRSIVVKSTDKLRGEP